MNDDLRLRISFEIEGRVARAFVEEQSRILRMSGSASEAAKSTIARAALVAFLNQLGYKVEDSTKWGGNQTAIENAEA